MVPQHGRWLSWAEHISHHHQQGADPSGGCAPPWDPLFAGHISTY